MRLLTSKGELTRLDGTSPPIHMTNAEAPIKVLKKTFWITCAFSFVRGDAGPFLISETMESYGMPDNLDETSPRRLRVFCALRLMRGRIRMGIFCVMRLFIIRMHCFCPTSQFNPVV